VYFAMSPFGYLLFAAMLVLPTKDLVRRTRRLQRIVQFAFTTMHRWLNLTRILRFSCRDARAALNIPDGPAVLVANHPTLTDSSALTAVIDELCMIARPDIYRRAMFKPLLSGLGYVNGPGRDPMSLQRVIDESLERLQDGHRVLFFPEGTRSPPTGHHPFGRAPFEVACRAGVPLISVALRSHPRWLWKGAGFFSLPDPIPRLTITQLDVCHPTPGQDSRALRDTVAARYLTLLEPPATQAIATSPETAQ
jgi:1-acyl-sn-glycerol-3-phosphate acyltransferase